MPFFPEAVARGNRRVRNEGLNLDERFECRHEWQAVAREAQHRREEGAVECRAGERDRKQQSAESLSASDLHFAIRENGDTSSVPPMASTSAQRAQVHIDRFSIPETPP